MFLAIVSIAYDILALVARFGDVSKTFYTVFAILSFTNFGFLAFIFLIANEGRVYRALFGILNIGIVIFIITILDEYQPWDFWDSWSIIFMITNIVESIIPPLVTVFETKAYQRATRVSQHVTESPKEDPDEVKQPSCDEQSEEEPSLEDAELTESDEALDEENEDISPPIKLIAVTIGFIVGSMLLLALNKWIPKLIL